MEAGRLFYVVGASGVGKDTLIRYARGALGDAPHIVFAHRYITRPMEAGGENHVELSDAEFALRKASGLFAMDWESNGLRYGIGIEIDAWRAKGLTVVVNGSRSYLPVARERCPDLKVVWISAGAETVAERLVSRGREARAEIATRLERNARLDAEPPREALRIDNDGALEAAGARLVALLSAKSL